MAEKGRDPQVEPGNAKNWNFQEMLQTVDMSAILTRSKNLGPFFSVTFLNRKNEGDIKDPEAEIFASKFLQSLQIGSVVCLVGGLLTAVRRGQLRPIFNRWGYALSLFAVLPANLYLTYPTSPDLARLNRLDAARIQRDRWSAIGAAALGPLFVIFDAKFLSGAQIGLALGVAASIGYDQWKLQQ